MAMRLSSRPRHARSDAPSGPTADQRLHALLLRTGAVAPEVLDRVAAEDSGESLARRLIYGGHLSDERLAALLAQEYGAPRQDFRDVTPAAEAIALLSSEQARGLGAVPLSLDGASATVAVLDPSPESVAAVAAAVGRSVTPVVASHRDLDVALDMSYRVSEDVAPQIHEFEVRDALRREAAKLETAGVNEDAPVVRVVQMILAQALRDRASDIHIEPFGERVRVRYRIDGALCDVLDLPGSIGPALVSRVKILASMNIVERRRPQDGQISIELEGREVDIRVSTTSVVGGEKLVMRVLDKSRPLYALKELGMPDDTADRFRSLLHSPFGMVICAGPTGAGKTTTLYAALGELNSPDRNLMTIEDPVEYTFDSINQIQINEQAGVTFATGLRSILRQDPDVILVGEVRDVETARIAVQSALTGHFVLSSLHATEAVAALHRLLDMGIEPFLIASSITAVVAQRLVRRSCTACLVPYQPTPEELAFMAAHGGHEPEGGYQRGAGCNFCAHTGFLERIGVYELLPVTEEIRSLVLSQSGHDQVREVARRQGMRTLQDQAVRLVEAGVTTAAEVMRTIYVVAV
jgi:type IV pilus assembly protein PilB